MNEEDLLAEKAKKRTLTDNEALKLFVLRCNKEDPDPCGCKTVPFRYMHKHKESRAHLRKEKCCELFKISTSIQSIHAQTGESAQTTGVETLITLLRRQQPCSEPCPLKA